MKKRIVFSVLICAILISICAIAVFALEESGIFSHESEAESTEAESIESEVETQPETEPEIELSWWERYVSGKQFPEIFEKIVERYNKKLAEDYDPTYLAGLTESQLEQLEKLGAFEKGYISHPLLEEMVKGNIDYSFERMTLQEAKELASMCYTTDDALDLFTDRNIFPDFQGGSGYTHYEFWLDNEGNEKIFIEEGGKYVFYIKNNDYENREVLPLKERTEGR